MNNLIWYDPKKEGLHISCIRIYSSVVYLQNLVSSNIWIDKVVLISQAKNIILTIKTKFYMDK